MSKREEQFDSHRLHNTLSEFKEIIDSYDIVDKEDEFFDYIKMFKESASYIDIRLAAAIKGIVNVAHLNNANTNLSKSITELKAFDSNKNFAHLNNCTNNLLACTQHVTNMPRVEVDTASEIYGQALKIFKDDVRCQLDNISKVKDSLLDSLNKLQMGLNEANDDLKEFRSKSAGDEKEISNKLNELSLEIDDVKSKYKISMDESLSSFRIEFSEMTEDQKSEHVSLLSQHSDFAKEIIKDLEDNKDAASRLVQVIGNTGITGNYKKIAKQEKEAADKWRNIALGLMLAMVLIIGATIFLATTNGFDWKLALFRIGAALILAIPAGYAARESSRHRELENHNQRAELELASLDPFLERLPEESAHAIKEKLTEKFFGTSISTRQIDDSVSTATLYELLKEAIKLRGK